MQTKLVCAVDLPSVIVAIDSVDIVIARVRLFFYVNIRISQLSGPSRQCALCMTSFRAGFFDCYGL